jgi:hypothetical protein
MATLQERLAEAEAAYHDLAIGKATVEFRDSNGETVRYTAANRAALSAYITDLKRQISGTATGPMWFVA